MRLIVQEELAMTEVVLLFLVTVTDLYVSFSFSDYFPTRCSEFTTEQSEVSQVLAYVQVARGWLPCLSVARVSAKAFTALTILTWGCIDLNMLCPELRLASNASKGLFLTAEETSRYAPRISARKREADLFRAQTSFACFVFETIVCWMTALVCLQLEGEEHMLEGGTLCLIVFLATIGFYLANRCLAKLTLTGAIQVETLHTHGLFYSEVTAPSSTCSNCKKSFHTKSPCEESYKCAECNFLACKLCFTAFNDSRTEGIEKLRRDDGLVAKRVFSTLTYLYKAITLVKPVWHLYTLSLIFVLASSICSLGKTHFQMSIITDLYTQQEADFWWNLKMCFLLTATQTLLSSLRLYMSGLCLGRVSPPVKSRLFKSLISQDIAFFDATSDEELISVFYHDVRLMLDAIRISVDTALLRFAFLAGNLLMCYRTSWKLTLLACTCIYPSYYISGTYHPWLSENGSILNDFNRFAMRTAHETFKNIRTVRAFSTEDKVYCQVHESILQWGLRLERSYLLQALARMCESSVSSVAELGTYFVGGLLILSRGSELSVTSLLEFQRYWNGFEDALANIRYIRQTVATSTKSAERAFAIMESLAYIDPHSGIVLRGEEVKGTLRIHNACFAYQLRPEAVILNCLSLDIERGTTVALVGKSGSGKSTLIKLLLRFYSLRAPSASKFQAELPAVRTGTITLDGTNINDINLPSLHKYIGYVGQETELFDTSVLGNIVYGLDEYRYTLADVERACRDAHAEEFILGFPDKYDTRIGQHGVRLSGGQKQRISLARCFLRNPKILLLDEPTSSLDSKSEALVQQAIQRLCASTTERTVLIVAHRLSTIKNADQIAVIRNGSIAEKGTHTELLAKGRLYAELVAHQLG